MWISLERDEMKKSLFSPIKTTKIPDEVYKQVVRLISSGELKPTQRLPSERAISLDLGVSRQSVREALYRAEAAGLIAVKPGEGSFVCSSMSKVLKAPLEVILREQADRLFEFLEIRKLIEGWCAEKSATAATTQDLTRMEKILEEMKKLKPGEKRMEELDRGFHFAMAEATHHVIGMHLMEALKINFDDYFDFKKMLEQIEKKDLLWQQHYDIYEAIKERNPRLAGQKLKEHLDFIEKTIRGIWEKKQFRMDRRD